MSSSKNRRRKNKNYKKRQNYKKPVRLQKEIIEQPIKITVTSRDTTDVNIEISCKDEIQLNNIDTVKVVNNIEKSDSFKSSYLLNFFIKHLAPVLKKLFYLLLQYSKKMLKILGSFIKTVCNVILKGLLYCFNEFRLNPLFCLVAICIITLLGINFKGYNNLKATNDKIVVTEPNIVVEHNNLTVTLDDTTENSIVYNWDSVTKERIKDFLADYTYVELEQINKTSVADSSVSTLLKTSLFCDFQQGRLKGFSKVVDSLGETHQGYFYDKGTNIYLSQAEIDGAWNHSSASTVKVNFSMKDYSSSTELYNFLLGDFPINTNTEGIIRENFLYFENVRNATEKDLINIDYDTIGDTQITLIFEIKDNMLKPVSLNKQVTFMKNDINYLCSLNIMIKELSNDTIEMPEYTEHVDTLSTNKISTENSLMESDVFEE